MRIAFWGNFGALNLGNECTLAAAVANFRARLPHADLVAVCRDPDDAARRHRIGGIAMSGRTQAVDDRGKAPKLVRLVRLACAEAADWLRVFRHASSIDALLITGSGILSDEDEGKLGLPYELLKWSLLIKLRGKKLFFVSVGAESLSRTLGRTQVKWALRLADYRSYRDSHSARLLQNIGFDTSRDAVRPDLAFSLPQSNAAAEDPMPAASRLERVAVGIFNYRDRGRTADNAPAYQAYLDSVCRLIAWLLERQHQVRVVVGDFMYDDAVRLDVSARLVQRGVNPAHPLLISEPTASFEELLDQLAAVDGVIATRYHNLILGLLLGKPVVSVSYEGKHEALMRSVGLGDYCQSIDDLDVDRLMQQFQRLESHADVARASIAAGVRANRTSLAEQYDLIVRSVCDSQS